VRVHPTVTNSAVLLVSKQLIVRQQMRGALALETHHCVFHTTEASNAAASGRVVILSSRNGVGAGLSAARTPHSPSATGSREPSGNSSRHCCVAALQILHMLELQALQAAAQCLWVHSKPGRAARERNGLVRRGDGGEHFNRLSEPHLIGKDASSQRGNGNVMGITPEACGLAVPRRQVWRRQHRQQHRPRRCDAVEDVRVEGAAPVCADDAAP
jgi:hypothetical protein